MGIISLEVVRYSMRRHRSGFDLLWARPALIFDFAGDTRGSAMIQEPNFAANQKLTLPAVPVCHKKWSGFKLFFFHHGGAMAWRGWPSVFQDSVKNMAPRCG
jgi:hypothetical protein